MKIPTKFLFSVALRFTTVLSGLGAFLISSYLYGPEGRGAITFVGSFYASLGLFLSFGMGRIMYQKITLQTYSVEDIQRTAMRFIHMVSGVVFLGALVVYLIRPQLLQFVLFFGLFVSYLWVNFSNYLYSASQKTHVHDRVIFLTRILQVVILLFAVPLKLDLHGFMVLYGITSIGVYLIEAVNLGQLKNSRHLSYRQSLKMMKAILAEVKWPYIESLAGTLAAAIPFLLGLYISKEELGNYTFALQIIITLYFPFSILQVKLQEQLGNVDERKAKTIIKKNFVASLLGSLPLMGSILIIPFVIRFVHLSHFDEAMPILRALMLTIPMMGLIFCFQGIWIGMHRLKFSALWALFGSGLNIILIPLMVRSSGAMSAVYAVYIANVINLVVASVYLRRSWKDLLEKKRIS